MSDTEDRREIEELLVLSAHAADRRDYDLTRSLYADGAYEDHGEYKGGIDGYIDFAKKSVVGMEASAHLFLRALIAIDGDRAESESVQQVFFRMAGPPPTNTICICRQFDRYLRTPRGWRFSHRAMCYDWMQSFPADAVQLPAGTILGTTDRSDPFYSQLPLLASQLRNRTNCSPAELA